MAATGKPVDYTVRNHVAVLTLNAPPVNGLSQSLRRAIKTALCDAEGDGCVEAVVLMGGGRMFCGGADIKEFASGEISEPDVNVIIRQMEIMDKPVVAAIHGVALGGGLELALGCNLRIATRDARAGFPEVRLGVLPGAGGTQRTPRLVGVGLALDLILSGRSIGAKEALERGLIDALSERDLLTDAIALARRACQSGDPLPVAGRLPFNGTSDLEQTITAALEQVLRRTPDAEAPKAIARCIAFAASGVDFEEGLVFEREEFLKLMSNTQSRALRHLFFAEREAAKIPNLPPDVALRPVERVGIIGAGVMGRGIAMTFLNAGIPVTLLEIDADALQRGVEAIRSNYVTRQEKGRMSAEDLKERMGLLRSSTNYDDMSDCDLVIEAVFENMEIKQNVCARLGEVCKPGAIIATNTSTLNVDTIANASGRASDVLGMHFFSPAHIMRLLEIVRGAETAPAVLATVIALARRIGKVTVVSGVCYGFIGNRMLESYLRELDFLLMEGATPARIDTALEAFGMAMGPCRMMDMAGIDVNARVLDERAAEGALPDDPGYRALVRKLAAMGRHGQKAGQGYYRYEGRTPCADPQVDRIAAELAATLGIPRRDDITDAEIRDRLLLPLINEGFRILEEGIALRPGDIDIVWTAGYGWPALTGGPMHHAEALGLGRVCHRLEELGRQTGDRFGYFAPAPFLLRRVADTA
ncbi:3-hydroxyacyl-CoA dehydrogenase NAD-binding domain-containing protein [Roseovarius pelagicus]|uniref:3-hydroxyacyl-CoA dehydrogenase NAD-binding domain-containing protein n=1 Tax=Roseovarius pelagicus TaxID=2980108 RepID=A0ABY6D5R8_9RHOB|nr:3-hydroxyacyl-CoA dehydrogenase NAD-binding domain-containing protein [Roseovarius pelagicus]UXX81490.1 3-hydroxyacyl-CoA dehydrogenase NAD-binding domain-containing protein [Roseovarius pelagicus]